MDKPTTSVAKTGAGSIVFLSERRASSLIVDGHQLFEADISGLPPVSKDDVAGIVAVLRSRDELRTVHAFGPVIRRQFIAILDHAVNNADLTQKSEFWDLFDLVMGLGVKARELADELELTPEMISRYRARSTAPAKLGQRRRVLVIAHRHAAEALALTAGEQQQVGQLSQSD